MLPFFLRAAETAPEPRPSETGGVSLRQSDLDEKGGILLKRSEINACIREADALFQKYGFPLPPFAAWSPGDWTGKGEEYDEIRDNALGWDITDFGMGDFARRGLTLFTLRNGNQKNRERYPKPYAQKLMAVKTNQLTPYHFHWNKMEDIICEGGAVLKIQFRSSAADGSFSGEPMLLHSDGKILEAPSGTVLTLRAGESVTILPGQYHQFWAEGGTAVVMEVSQCNDDTADNRFYEKTGRFPVIEEDEKPFRLLCGEYPRAAK